MKIASIYGSFMDNISLHLPLLSYFVYFSLVMLQHAKMCLCFAIHGILLELVSDDFLLV